MLSLITVLWLSLLCQLFNMVRFMYMSNVI